jgi:hypothetical protein
MKEEVIVEAVPISKSHVVLNHLYWPQTTPEEEVVDIPRHATRVHSVRVRL